MLIIGYIINQYDNEKSYRQRESVFSNLPAAPRRAAQWVESVEEVEHALATLKACTFAGTKYRSLKVVSLILFWNFLQEPLVILCTI